LLIQALNECVFLNQRISLKFTRYLHKITVILFLFITGSFFYPVSAQPDSSGLHMAPKINTGSDTQNLKKLHNQKDLADVFESLIKHKKNMGAETNKLNTGRYHFSIVPAVGYTLSTGLAGIVATNVGFYTNDPDHTNVSSIQLPVVYTQYNQLTIPLLMDLWTKDNKYNIDVDWRYYKYPQDSYGLGGHSSLLNADQIDYSHIRIHQTVMRDVGHNFYAGAGYFLDYHWNIEEEGLADSTASGAKKYGLPSKSMSSGPVLALLYDSRKSSINPQGGIYANILYHPNFTFLGSDNNWQSLTIDVRKYIKFPCDNILAFWGYAWLTPSGNPPYLDLPSTGWDTYNNTGRGYIQGRFRSKNMLYAETEYRFGITSNGLLGGVIFANAQSFSNYPSNNFDAIWPGAGLGIRIKVNKNSNTNIAIDYGFGQGNSRGFFVNLGELF